MECTTGDGLKDEDRDEREWSKSDKVCFCCEDTMNFGDECVQLRLVYPSSHNGQAILLDALEADTGEFTEEPLHFCFSCWDAHVEDLRTFLEDLFISRKKSVGASTLRCCFCSAPLNWGEYLVYAAYGELNVSPRTGATNFTLAKNETLETAELLCMDCLEWINDNLEENIWMGLWTEETEPNEDLWWKQQAQGI
jgi:hypothetical protein